MVNMTSSRFNSLILGIATVAVLLAIVAASRGPNLWMMVVSACLAGLALTLKILLEARFKVSTRSHVDYREGKAATDVQKDLVGH
jgi:hypothetical protein